MVVASLSNDITHQIAVHGVYAVFAMMALDAVFPAASELVMLYAGAAAAGIAGHRLRLAGMSLAPGLTTYLALSIAGTTGYLAGSLIGWLIGRLCGEPLLEAHGQLIHLSPERLERARRWFDRWGAIAILVGRLTPVVRSFVSIPAGAFEVPLVAYGPLTLVASAVWAFGFAGLGWALGSGYKRFDHGFKYAEYLVVAALVVPVAIPLVARLFGQHPRKHSDGG